MIFRVQKLQQLLPISASPYSMWTLGFLTTWQACFWTLHSVSTLFLRCVDSLGLSRRNSNLPWTAGHIPPMCFSLPALHWEWPVSLHSTKYPLKPASLFQQKYCSASSLLSCADNDGKSCLVCNFTLILAVVLQEISFGPSLEVSLD